MQTAIPYTETVKVQKYRIDCTLCDTPALVLTEAEHEALTETEDEPWYSVTFDGDTTAVTTLCDNCKAFLRDRTDAMLKPIKGPRRYTGQKPPVPAGDVSASQATQEPSGGDNGAGAEEGAE